MKIIADRNIFSEDELAGYVRFVQEQVGSRRLDTLTVTLDGEDEVKLDYQLVPVRFERIRRITGYLVGTVDRWNNAKKAELKDRVAHNARIA